MRDFGIWDHAFYASIHYGKAAGDVLHIVFDCSKKLAPHDVIYLYIKGHRRYGRPVRLRGRKRGDSYGFPTVALNSTYGAVSVEETFKLHVRSLWDAGRLDADLDVMCKLSHSETMKKSSFRLRGDIEPVMNSAVYIEPVRLLTSPELKGRWDHRSDPPHVRGKIGMGKLGLMPEIGISDKADLIVYEQDESKPRMKRRFRVAPGGAYTEFTFYPWKRLREQKEYDMKLSMDLGPFFQALSVTDRMVLR